MNTIYLYFKTVFQGCFVSIVWNISTAKTTRLNTNTTKAEEGVDAFFKQLFERYEIGRQARVL